MIHKHREAWAESLKRPEEYVLVACNAHIPNHCFNELSYTWKEVTCEQCLKQKKGNPKLNRQCVVCGEDAVEIVLYDSAICAEHKVFSDRGYVAIVEVDVLSTKFEEDGSILPQNARLTGPAAMIKRTQAKKILGLNDEKMAEFLFFVDTGTIAFLKSRTICSN